MKYDEDEINRRMKLYAAAADGMERISHRNYVLEGMLDEGIVRNSYRSFLNVNPNNNPDMEIRRTSTVENLFFEIYEKLLLECVKKYDPDLGVPFTKYFFSLLKRRRLDILRSKEYKKDSITDLYMDDGNHRNKIGLSVKQTVSDSGSVLLICCAEIIQMKDRLLKGGTLAAGKQKTLRNHIVYYRLFYTDLLSSYLIDVADIKNIRMLVDMNKTAMAAADVGFLDYFMEKLCRSVREIYDGRTKRLCDIDCAYTDKSDDKRCPLPMSGKIMLGYSEKIDSASSQAKISTIRKEFLSVMRSGVSVRGDGKNTEVFFSEEDTDEPI